MENSDVIIVGGGIAGLACARELHARGITFRLFEASDNVGGRIRTDQHDGFLLDRGFQVLLTAYPEAKRLLDYERLRLGTFEPGALVRYQGRFHRFADPLRQPSSLFETLLSPLGTFGDKLKILQLRSRVCRGQLNDLRHLDETSTLARLKELGFSEGIINRFFRPFLGGIYLEPDLATSSRKLDFVFRMFSIGEAALPESGMQAIPDQMAESLPKESVFLNSPVTHIESGSVTLKNGETYQAKEIVVACDQSAAAKLLHQEQQPSCHSSCLYFAAEKPPVEKPILVLNGDLQGPINNLSVQSQVCGSYAPKGQSLISVTVIKQDQTQIEAEVAAQLEEWFGRETRNWQHLRTYQIPDAIPFQTHIPEPTESTPVMEGIYRCGDYRDIASLNGAIASGRQTAETIQAKRSAN